MHCSSPSEQGGGYGEGTRDADTRQGKVKSIVNLSSLILDIYKTTSARKMF